MKIEREKRAKAAGAKKATDVPTADALTIRVIAAGDKKTDTKPLFAEFCKSKNVPFPDEFKYRSKVILLFQHIEGVDVCLFGMYVQEYGQDAPPPNTRRVYLSYIDSIKYFRPEVISAIGKNDALRTYVYHEILLGYLQHCKSRGFTSMYIWACPPLQGDDYILYCHPQRQKVPQSGKLREWYLRMLRRAMEQGVVFSLSNLYDVFFPDPKCPRGNCSSVNLPYFEGDYWPGAAEEILTNINQELEDAKKNGGSKKNKAAAVKNKKSKGKQSSVAISPDADKDEILMQKVGEIISPMKEDFIMVYLYPTCSHCRATCEGCMYKCIQCKDKVFALCQKCYDEECLREERQRHPPGSVILHDLTKVPLSPLPSTKDPDGDMECEIFDTRQSFLSLCQGNHYQFDTLRRAKHSSMMVLYHLHNPSEPAFTCTCNICQSEIPQGKGFRCDVCPDFDVCLACKSKPDFQHAHPLQPHSSVALQAVQPTGDKAVDAEREARHKQLQRTMELLVHASSCTDRNCPSSNCLKVKALFNHGLNCKIKFSNGCQLCRRMWALLQIHAKGCRATNCPVPRCKELKEFRRRSQQQSEDRRRAAYAAMARQQKAMQHTGITNGQAPS